MIRGLLLPTTGEIRAVEANYPRSARSLAALIGCDYTEAVRIRYEGARLAVNELGAVTGAPANPLATDLYPGRHIMDIAGDALLLGWDAALGGDWRSLTLDDVRETLLVLPADADPRWATAQAVYLQGWGFCWTPTREESTR